MNKTLKTITAATLILACGGLSAFAKNAKKTNSDKNYEYSVDQKKDCKKGKKDAKRPEPESFSGKITVSGSDENKTVTLKTEKGTVYTLTTVPGPDGKKDDRRLPPPKPENMKEKDADANEKAPAPDGEFNPENKPDFNPDMKPADSDKKSSDRPEPPKDGKGPKPVTMKQITELNGKTVTVKGFLNKESSVITVFELED